MNRRSMIAGAAAALAAPAIGRAQTATALTFFYPIAVGGAMQSIIDGYCADYRKETGVTVTPVYSGNFTETLTKTLAAIRAGQGPHLALLLAAEIHSLRESGILASLDELGGDAASATEGFYPAFLVNSHGEGKTWSMPFQRSTMVAYYNKRAFEQAGLDPDLFPGTWDAFGETCAKLVKKDGGRVTRWGVKIAGDLGFASWTMGALANQAGQVLMNEAGNQTYFDAAKTVEAMQYWRSLDTQYHATPPGLSQYTTLAPDFLEGNTAIFWHTSGTLGGLRDKASFPFGVAPVPGKAGPRTVVGGGNLYFFKHASPAERAASLQFARWLAAPARAADWSIRTGYVATGPAAYEAPAMKDYLARFPAAAVPRDSLPNATGELSTYENQRIQKVITDQIQAVLNGSKEPGPAMASAQAEAARLLRPFL